VTSAQSDVTQSPIIKLSSILVNKCAFCPAHWMSCFTLQKWNGLQMARFPLYVEKHYDKSW